jgi:hypothetical protein
MQQQSGAVCRHQPVVFPWWEPRPSFVCVSEIEKALGMLRDFFGQQKKKKA